MKRAVVVGALSFVGYHLVQKLLAEEVEVIAFDIEDLSRMSQVNEEKLLLIGRHANFSYRSIKRDEAWFSVQEQQPDVVYFCLCEPNQYKAFEEQECTKQVLNEVISFCRQYEKMLIMLSSIYAPDALKENGAWFHMLEKRAEVLAPSFTVLRVPSVYGPWQPAFMAYHQLIRSNEASIETGEDNTDVVYAGDVAECLYRLGAELVAGVYYMESGETGQWQKGIELLHGEGKVRATGEKMKQETGIRYTYEPSCSLQEGLEKQVLHVNQYKQLYEEEN